MRKKSKEVNLRRVYDIPNYFCILYIHTMLTLSSTNNMSCIVVWKPSISRSDLIFRTIILGIFASRRIDGWENYVLGLHNGLEPSFWIWMATNCHFCWAKPYRPNRYGSLLSNTIKNTLIKTLTPKTPLGYIYSVTWIPALLSINRVRCLTYNMDFVGNHQRH